MAILDDPIIKPNILLSENNTNIAVIAYSKYVISLFGLIFICNFLNKLSIKISPLSSILYIIVSFDNIINFIYNNTIIIGKIQAF